MCGPLVCFAVGLTSFSLFAQDTAVLKTPAQQFAEVETAFANDVKSLTRAPRNPLNGFGGISKLPGLKSPTQDAVSCDELAGVVKKTKASIRERIPSDDVALHNYVNDYPVVGSECHTVQRKTPGTQKTVSFGVERSYIDMVIEGLQKLISSLKRMPAFRLNMEIVTTPPASRFELFSKGGIGMETTTNDTITNVWRCAYQYRVTKSGYKTIEGSVNLIDQAGNVLECQLQADDSKELALPCRLK